MTSIRLEHLASKGENSFVSNFKVSDYFLKLWVAMIFAGWWPLDRLQAIITLCSFSFLMK